MVVGVEVVACCRGELPVESLKLLHKKAQLLETLLGSLVPVSMDDLADDSKVTSHLLWLAKISCA